MGMSLVAWQEGVAASLLFQWREAAMAVSMRAHDSRLLAATFTPNSRVDPVS